MSELLDQQDRLDDYIAAGGTSGLERARGMTPEAVIAEIQRSGLRGRGGAGFPTGRKWTSVASAGSGPRYVICNGAEGEPATFKDRLLMRRNPYQILEGVAIAAYAVGAQVAYVGVKESFGPESTRVAEAIDDMQAAGMFEDLKVELVLGPDRYLFGEETGLIGVIEGRGPLPRVVRPFMHGPFAKTVGNNPTVENNVETLANVAHILAHGPDWLRSRGTDGSPGSMLFTICGEVAHEGVFELPLGTPLRHLVSDCAGATDVKVIVPGASNAVILPSQLDVPMDFESLRLAGTGLGAAGFCVFDSRACIVDVARLYARFLYVESCGQCPSCKDGGEEISTTLEALQSGTGTAGDVALLAQRAGWVTDGQKCALPTGLELFVLSVLRSFETEFREHGGRECPSDRQLVLPKIVDLDEDAGRFTYDESYVSVDPDWSRSE